MGGRKSHAKAQRRKEEESRTGDNGKNRQKNILGRKRISETHAQIQNFNTFF